MRELINVVGKMKLQSAEKVLLGLLHKSQYLREVIEVMGEMKLESSKQILLNHLNSHTNKIIRCCAAESLGKIGADDVLPKIKSILKTEQHPSVKVYIRKAIDEINEIND